MNLEPEIVALLAVIVASSVVLLALAVVGLSLRVRGLGKRYVKAFANGEHDVVTTLAAFANRLERAEAHGALQEATAHRLADTLNYAVSHAAVVRYDAFSDMGGEQSFSLAILDAHGTGVVLSAINGRSDTRVYAKPVRDGVSDATLSPEEQQVIALSQERHKMAQMGKP